MSDDSLFCGPDQLAKAVIDYREQQRQVFDIIGIRCPVLLDDWIHQLVKLVYHASLLSDEGRFPKFRLVFTNQSFGQGFNLTDSWRGHRIDSPDSLRRLAPAVAGHETAVLVRASNEGLTAWRIVDFERFCAGPPVDSNRLCDFPDISNGVLFLRCDAPGDLRVMLHPSPVFHLRGGAIRTLDSFYAAVKPFKALVLTLCRELHNTVKADKRIEYYVPNPQVFADDFADLWAASLSTAVEGRHGGAFAIVPSPDCFHLRVKYKAEGGLFAAFEETLRHCLDSLDSSGHLYLAIFKQYWQSHQDHLRRVARLIGQLAATDGCVVLDRRLNVQGFGAKIDWPHNATFLPLVDARSDQQVPDEQIEQGMGTRHRSACRLAQLLPNAIIFVVSQDGDLTAFYSDDSRAYWLTRLDAWSSVAELL